VENSKTELSQLLKAPISQQQLAHLIQSVNALEKEQKNKDNQSEEFMEESRQFRELSATELQACLLFTCNPDLSILSDITGIY
jgi:hypothetical protein